MVLIRSIKLAKNRQKTRLFLVQNCILQHSAKILMCNLHNVFSARARFFFISMIFVFVARIFVTSPNTVSKMSRTIPRPVACRSFYLSKHRHPLPFGQLCEPYIVRSALSDLVCPSDFPGNHNSSQIVHTTRSPLFLHISFSFCFVCKSGRNILLDLLFKPAMLS